MRSTLCTQPAGIYDDIDSGRASCVTAQRKNRAKVLNVLAPVEQIAAAHDSDVDWVSSEVPVIKRTDVVNRGVILGGESVDDWLAVLRRKGNVRLPAWHQFRRYWRRGKWSVGFLIRFLNKVVERQHARDCRTRPHESNGRGKVGPDRLYVRPESPCGQHTLHPLAVGFQ
jgi:hypothetical protein